jgi:carboxymethylenebutenolidase
VSGLTVTETIVDVATPEGAMAVLVKKPSGVRVPTVVMWHDGPGIRRATHHFARSLAAEGFTVIVPDLYHRHGRLIGFEMEERAADPTIVERLWELLRSLTDEGFRSDLDSTVAALGLGEATLATIGFCVGARAAYRAVEHRPGLFGAAAMWHPSYLVDGRDDSPHLTASGWTLPLFVGIGEADTMQPLERLRPFVDAVAGRPDVDVRTFPGAEHGYTWVGWPSYDAEAARQSFDATVALFRAATALTR